MPTDKNSYKNVFYRLKKAIKNKFAKGIFKELQNLVINIEFSFLVNF